MTTSTCHLLLTSGFTYPNGLARGADGMIYVPTVQTGEIHVLNLSFDASGPSLRRLTILYTGYPLDNLSLDKRTGDIYASTFPKLPQTIESFHRPLEINPPSGVLRIRRRAGDALDYEVTKVLEDNGTVLPGSTVVVHDSAEPERFFLGGTFSLLYFQVSLLMLSELTDQLDCYFRSFLSVYYYLRKGVKQMS